MATKQDYTDAQKLTKSYYDSQNERELAGRQLISAQTTAREDAFNRGYKNIKDSSDPEYSKSAYNPKNWDSTLDKKVTDQLTVYGNAAREEKKQKALVAEYVNTSYENVNDGEISPEENSKALLAAGLKPGDISSALYSSGFTTQKDKEINDRADNIVNQAKIIDKDLETQQDQNFEKFNEITEKLNNPNLTPEERDNLETQLEQTKNIGNTLEKQRSENSKNLDKTSALNIAKTELNNADNLNARNVENTTKLSNTGFESINNHAPFYMQMPTLQAIKDFRLKNGKNPYGEKSVDSIARDAVNFRIFETVPGVAKAETVPGTKLVRNVIDDSRIQSVGSFTIYPSDMNWLSQSHSHTYGGGGEDWVASTINSLGEGYSAIQSLMKVGAGATQALAQGSLKGLNPSGDVYQRRLEVLKYYQESAPQTMTITFNLFTKKDFLNDVFRPIMFLTALGYPKRALQGEGANNFKKIFESIRQYASEGNTWATDILKGAFGENIQTLLSKPLELAQELENSVASMGGIGPYRYFISKRPEFLSVRHVSGLFYFPLANITGFNYTFKGPWYNYEGKLTNIGPNLESIISQKMTNYLPNPNLSLKERADQIFKNFANEVSSAIKNSGKTPSTPTRVSGTPVQINEMQYAYPSYAECSLTIQSSIPFFRDDYMSLYTASLTSPEQLVMVTQKNTGDERFYGNRKSLDNQVYTNSSIIKG